MMNQIKGIPNGFGNYGKNSGGAVRREKPNEPVKSHNTDAVEISGMGKKNEVTGLSEKAQKLLNELKAKYGDTDFIIADYSSDEEASALLSGGKKEYSVLIDPESLEEMANDENVRAEYESVIENTRAQLNEVGTQLADKGASVRSVSATVADDGTVALFAELEEISKNRNEQIEEAREHAREERAEEKKKAEKEEKEEKNSPDNSEKKNDGDMKIMRVSAATTDELIAKIYEVLGIDATENPDKQI